MPRVDIRSIRRRQILDAAEQVAAQKGWIGTTIADICQTANVSTGVVTRHFESKDEIMLAALEDVLEQLQALLTPYLGRQKPVSEDIRSRLTTLSQSLVSQRTLLQLLLHFAADAISRPEIAERLQAFFSHIRQQHMVDLTLVLEEQNIPVKNPVLLVNLFQNLIFGLILSSITFGSDLPAEQLGLHSANMLLKYFDLPPENKE